MNGFIKSYATRCGDNCGQNIMKCFSPEHIPVLANLSMEYGIFDGWFASVPGPTEVNRCYASAATSYGMGTNDKVAMATGLPQKTMFSQLQEMGLDFRVYFGIAPAVLMFKDMRVKEVRRKYRPIGRLYKDLAAGRLPQYSWVEPNYFDEGEGRPADDQHPDHDVSAGDALLKRIYDALRASPLWEKTALLITYDEHGGFFDHVPPPANVPSPDDILSTDDPFTFTRLGVRVPAVLVSPWVPRGSVFHAAPQGQGQFEHASIVSTVVHKLLKPAPGFPAPAFLNKRDAWAATFEGALAGLPAPRTDCPLSAPQPESHRAAFPDTLPPLDGLGPLSDWQRSLMAIAAGASGDSGFPGRDTGNWTESQGAAYCRQRMEAFFEGQEDGDARGGV